MRILIVDAPGAHPESYPRVLGTALHRLGHSAIVHPAKDATGPWPFRHKFRRHAREVLAVHKPDIVHVISREPWVADAFVARGAPVFNSSEGRVSRSEWVVVPTRAALNVAAGSGQDLDVQVGRLPYALEVAPAPASFGSFVRVFAPRGDARAARWVKEAAQAAPFVPIRLEGDVREARAVLSLASDPGAWPAGVPEAMAAGRPVVTTWSGPAQEFVLEGVTGFLSAPGDVKSIAAHLAFLWDHPEDARRMGAEGAESAKEEFDPAAHAKMLVRWYLRAGVSRLAV